MGFPPKTKNTSKTIPDMDCSTITKGSGGIPASLKVKNAAVKSAPTKNFIEGSLGIPTGSDKTNSSF